SFTTSHLLTCTSSSSHDTYTLSLHDALPIFLNEEHPHSLEYLASLYFGAPNYDIPVEEKQGHGPLRKLAKYAALDVYYTYRLKRSEEHTSELQSRENLVCRLLLEKKKYV